MAVALGAEAPDAVLLPGEVLRSSPPGERPPSARRTTSRSAGAAEAGGGSRCRSHPACERLEELVEHHRGPEVQHLGTWRRRTGRSEQRDPEEEQRKSRGPGEKRRFSWLVNGSPRYNLPYCQRVF